MAAAGGDVEAALKEADKAAKKQKVCSSSSEAAVDQLLQVGRDRENSWVLGWEVGFSSCRRCPGQERVQQNAYMSPIEWLTQTFPLNVLFFCTPAHLLQAVERARARLAAPGAAPQVRFSCWAVMGAQREGLRRRCFAGPVDETCASLHISVQCHATFASISLTMHVSFHRRLPHHAGGAWLVRLARLVPLCTSLRNAMPPFMAIVSLFISHPKAGGAG